MSARHDALLMQLAQAAGLQTVWRDVHAAARRVGPETLRAVLASMGLECQGPAQCAASLELLHKQDDSVEHTGLALVHAGAALVVRARGSLHYRVQLEGGGRVMGTARDIGRGRAMIPAFRQPGYHHLEMGASMYGCGDSTARTGRGGIAAAAASKAAALLGPGNTGLQLTALSRRW